MPEQTPHADGPAIPPRATRRAATVGKALGFLWLLATILLCFQGPARHRASQAHRPRDVSLSRDDFAALAEARWLDEAHAAELRGLAAALEDVPRQERGTLPPDALRRVREFKSRLLSLAAQNLGTPATSFEAITLANDFTRGADDLERLVKARSAALAAQEATLRATLVRAALPEELRQRVEQSFARKTPFRFRTFLRHPYVLCVEEGPGPPSIVLADRLALWLSTFHREFSRRHRTPVTPRPLPALCLRGAGSFAHWALGTDAWLGQAEAYFEPRHGWLVVADDAKPTTIVHEACHQIVAERARHRPRFEAQSLWFEEGFAEWWGGVLRSDAGTSTPQTFSFGLLQIDRVASFEALRLGGRVRPYSLKELLSMTMSSRIALAQEGDAGAARLQMLYAQSWMFVHFLRHFDADADGRARLPEGRAADGRYSRGFDRYLGFELAGKGGRPHSGRHAFVEALALDERGLNTMAAEFSAYQDFLVRKIRRGQYHRGVLVPWRLAASRPGEPPPNDRDDILAIETPK